MGEKNKIAVLFPGIGYTCDRPLLYYAGKCAGKAGYEVLAVPYGDFPGGVRGDREKMEYCFRHALDQAKEILKGIIWSEYEEILFVGKSVGTIVASAYAKEYNLDVRSIVMTPLADTFAFLEGKTDNVIVFHGSNDPWAETSLIKQICEEKEYPLILTEGANHSLETGNMMQDLDTLKYTMEKICGMLS